MTGKTVRVVAMSLTDAVAASLVNPTHLGLPMSTQPATDENLTAGLTLGPQPSPEHEAVPGVELEPAVEPEPIPITKNDFRHFGREYGYEKTRAGRAWNKVFYTAREDYESKDEGCGLPAIRYVGVTGYAHPYKRDEAILDLRSVYERLVASGWGLGAWDGATKADIAFLTHLMEGWGVV